MTDYDDDLLAARRKAADLARPHIDRHPSAGGRVGTLKPNPRFDAAPGWRIFSTGRTYNDDPEPELRSPMGGICVEVNYGRQLHPETGEIGELTTYRCLNTWRQQDPWVYLLAEEIDPHHLAGVDRLGCWHAILWLHKQIHTRRRSLGSDDADHIGDMWRLARAMA